MKMKAAVYTKYGPPDVFQIKNVEKPTPKKDEVLVRVYTTTANRTDCGFLRAKPFIVRFFSGLTKPKRTILGNEFSGVVEKIGKNVTSFKVGDKVFGYTEPEFGAHAEYLTMNENKMITTVPNNMTFDEIAPSSEGAHYALNYVRKAKVDKNKNVLVYGATGAIGSAAVQLVKHYGSYVTAVCATENLELVKSLGADEVIDYTKKDFTHQTNKKYDFVFDAVGKTSFFHCKNLLKPNGVFCSTDLGFLVQNPLLAIWTVIFGGIPFGKKSKKVLFPIPREEKKDILFLKELIENCEFKPVIDRKYPLEKIKEAFEYVETGKKIGNVLIKVRDGDEID